MILPESITCPKCNQTSFNQQDVEYGYCGHCHWWTSDFALNHFSNGIFGAQLSCKLAHADQFRWDKTEYYLHPFAVADLVRLNNGNEETIIAAYLHDIVEDTDVSIEAIREYFGDRVAEIVDLVSKPLGMPYSEFIDRVCTDADAMLLKRCDIIHNLSTLPMSHGMNDRYLKALHQIYEAARKL